MAKKLKVEIELGNTAFEDGFEGRESARILKQLAEWLLDYETLDGYKTSLRDANGNVVGRAWEGDTPAEELLGNAIDDWPEFDEEEAPLVSGADLSEWFGNFRDRCKKVLER